MEPMAGQETGLLLERPEKEVPERYRRAFAAVERGERGGASAGPYRSPGGSSEYGAFETMPFVAQKSSKVVGYGCALLFPVGLLGLVTWFLAVSATASLERVQGSRLDEFVIGGAVWVALMVVTVRIGWRVRREYAAQQAFERGAYGYYLFDDAVVIRRLDHCTVLPRSAVTQAWVTTSPGPGSPALGGATSYYASVTLRGGLERSSVTLPAAGHLSLEELRQRIQSWIENPPSAA